MSGVAGELVHSVLHNGIASSGPMGIKVKTEYVKQNYKVRNKIIFITS